MGEKETLRMIRSLYGSILISAAGQYRHRPEVLAGIMMRETAGGTSHLLDCIGPAGRGDGGHGHGLMQIDDRSFPEFCQSDRWADPKWNILMGAEVLAGKLQALRKLTAIHLIYGMEAEDMERAAIAAYNCGAGRVVQALTEGKDVDAHTAGKNYSSRVLAAAALYLEEGNGGSDDGKQL